MIPQYILNIKLSHWNLLTSQVKKKLNLEKFPELANFAAKGNRSSQSKPGVSVHRIFFFHFRIEITNTCQRDFKKNRLLLLIYFNLSFLG